MDKRKFLQQMQSIRKRIDNKRLQIELYREMADAPAGVRYDKVGGSAQRSTEAPFMKWLYLIDEKEHEIAELQKRLDEIERTAVAAINRLEREDYRTVLTLRYLQGAAWEDIAQRIYVSNRTVYRWHYEALELLEIPET